MSYASWKRLFLTAISKGLDEQKAIKSAGINKSILDKAMQEDVYFLKAVKDASSKDNETDIRVLTPASLEKLLWAQVDDKKCSAFFGFEEVEEFLAEIAEDPVLKKIHKIGRDAGKAQLMLAQMESGIETRKEAQLQFLGAQHLGQKKEPTVIEISAERRISDEELAKIMIFSANRASVLDNDKLIIDNEENSHDTD